MPVQNSESEFESESEIESEGDHPFGRPCRNDGERAIAKAAAEICADGNADHIFEGYTMDDAVEAGKLLSAMFEEPDEPYFSLRCCLDYSWCRGTREQIVSAINLALELGIVWLTVIEEEDCDTVAFIARPRYQPRHTFLD